MLEFKNTSIRKKLITIQLATAFLAVLICCVFFVFNDVKIFKQSSVENKFSIAEIVGINAASALEFNDGDAAKAMLQKLKSNPTILNAAIFDKTGKEFARYNKPGEENFLFPRPGSDEISNQRGFGQKYLVSYSITDKGFLGTVMLRAEITDLGDIIFGYIKIAATILLASLAVAFFISTILQRSITSRVLTLVHKSKLVAETGNYSIRASTDGSDEIAVLSAAFNNMLDQIEKMKTDLHNTNIELEERVKIRTRELEMLNNELRSKSEELMRSNNELGQFAYVASHDLQEPLRTISNYINLLEEKYAGQFDEETDMFVNFILNATATMKNLISHLLDYSRIGTNVTFEPVDCNQLMKELMNDMQQGISLSGASIRVAGLPVITANAISLKQLIQNLVSNAMKFRKKDVAPVIEITATERPGDWLFAIKDNGIGMEKKYQDKIFIIFQRLHNSSEYPGTGIGLATCKKIASLHQGSIWVESAPGQGSTFYFTISKNLNNQPETIYEKSKMHLID